MIAAKHNTDRAAQSMSTISIKKQQVKAVFYLLPWLIIVITPPSLATDLGRLFTTATQRAALQKIRNDSAKQEIEQQKKEQTSGKSTVTAPPPEPMGTLYLRGIVYRADGKHHVWISDGENPNAALQINEYIETIKPDRLYLSLPGQPSRQIKAGEYLDLRADEKKE